MDAIAMSRMTDVLMSSTSSPELGDAAALYAPVIGSWDVEVVDLAPDGSRQVAQGEWHFCWALEGRAVQDVFIVPRRELRSGVMTKKGNRYGTSLRYYDPASREWIVTWINPVTCAVNRLNARNEGSRIVQVGTDPDGTMRRWCFEDLTADSFHWTGEASSDEGRTWRLEVEFFASRQRP